MKILSILTLITIAAYGSTAYGTHAFVTSDADNGAGSLRAALASGARQITINKRVANIRLESPLEYSATQSLRLSGNGVVLDGSSIQGNGDVISVTQGANTVLTDLTIIGNVKQPNRQANTPLGGKGLDISIPASRTGVVRVNLENVTVSRVGHHGIHVSDCSLGDDCGAGSGGGGEGSAASIKVSLKDVIVNKVGFGRADADGVRVDDRGPGSIYFSAIDSQFLNVGADGVELDEGNEGNVVALVRNSIFDGNGEYCNLVDNFENSPCDDDGDRDVDDGFDIDEAGPGTLFAKVMDSQISNNFDEGLDFDAEDQGGAEVAVLRVIAFGNRDEGIKVSEEGDGNVNVRLNRVALADNNEDKEGIEIEEEDQGDLRVSINRSYVIEPALEMLKLEQSGPGVGEVHIRQSNVSLDLDGVEQL